MIAEHTSAFELTSNPATSLRAAIEHRPRVSLAILHRFATACARFVKAPVLPYAELWEASLTADWLREREPRSRPAECGIEMDCRTDVWLRR
jgi:hypothetical protein